MWISLSKIYVFEVRMKLHTFKKSNIKTCPMNKLYTQKHYIFSIFVISFCSQGLNSLLFLTWDLFLSFLCDCFFWLVIKCKFKSTHKKHSVQNIYVRYSNKFYPSNCWQLNIYRTIFLAFNSVLCVIYTVSN